MEKFNNILKNKYGGKIYAHTPQKDITKEKEASSSYPKLLLLSDTTFEPILKLSILLNFGKHFLIQFLHY